MNNLNTNYMQTQFLNKLEGKSIDEQLQIVWEWTLQRHISLKEYIYVMNIIYEQGLCNEGITKRH